jgi:SAM-dependent methyltransferase
MGSGRDSIYLAQKGWTAVGFDRSTGGVALALENAKKAGVTINALASGATEFEWGKERFDLVSNIHSMGVQEFLPQIHAALKTGGIYVVELRMLAAFKDKARMSAAYMPNEPMTFFREGWRIIRYEDVPGFSDCAGCRQVPGRVVRLVAQKINAADWR